MGLFTSDFFGKISSGVRFLAPHLLSIASSIISPVNAEILSDDVAWHFLGCMKQFTEKLEYLNMLLSIRNNEDLPVRSAAASELSELPVTILYKSVVRSISADGLITAIDLRRFSEEVDKSIKIVNQKYFLEIIAHEAIYYFFEVDNRMSMRTEKIRLLVDQISPSMSLNHRPTGKYVFPPKNSLEDGFLKLKNDALLALARINPNRLLASSGSLAVQGTRFMEMEIEDLEYQSAKEAMSAVYNHSVRKVKKSSITTVVDDGEHGVSEVSVVHIMAFPKATFISEDMFSKIFYDNNKKKIGDIRDISAPPLNEIRMYDFWRLDSLISPMDPNYSVCSITDKILGSSRTSLNFMIEFCHVYGIWLSNYFKSISFGNYDYDAFFSKRDIEKPEIVSNVEVLIAKCHDGSLRRREVLELFDALYSQIDFVEDLLFTYGLGREILEEMLGS